MKLLIVEDDKFLREFLEEIFAEEFDEVVGIGRFSEFRDISIADTDVAVVDLGLPPSVNTYEEGLKVIKYLKNSSNAKIIVLTGQESDEAAIESIAEGVYDYIQKPADVEDIKRVVKRAKFIKEKEDAAIKKGKMKIEISVENSEDFKNVREKAERKFLENLLKIHNDNVSRLAKDLNITREKVYYYLKKFNLR